MTTSGTYIFDPVLAEMVDEAFERIGMEPQSIGLNHIISARRSMNFLLKSWTNHGVHWWAVVNTTQAVSVDMTSFQLPVGGIDIVSMVLRRSGVDTEMYQISRQDYHTLHDKDLKGRPDRFFVDRATGQPTVYIWPAGENSTDVLDYWYFRQIQDAGSARKTLDMPHYFYEAFVAGLAMKLAEKYQPERLEEKVALYRPAFQAALDEDGSRASLVISRGGRR